MRRQITLSEVMSGALQTERATLYHCWPGSIVTYYASEQTADVQIMVNDVRFDLDTGARFSEQWPVAPHVPVSWPRFGGFCISGPMAAGDSCVLIAFDVDPTAWQQTGNRSDPADARRHVGSYWFVIPCNLTTGGVMQDASAAGTQMVMGVDGAAPQIRFTNENIQLGNMGGDFVALASLVMGELNKIATSFSKAQAPPGTAGGPLMWVPPTDEYTSPGNVASSLIKAQ